MIHDRQSRWDVWEQRFNEASEAYISTHEGEKVRDVLDKVYSSEPSDLDSTLAQLQFASLPREDW